MAKIGYMPYLPKYAEGAADRKWMEDFGCENIVEEQPVEGAYRLGWDRPLGKHWQRRHVGHIQIRPCCQGSKASCHSFWNSAG